MMEAVFSTTISTYIGTQRLVKWLSRTRATDGQDLAHHSQPAEAGPTYGLESADKIATRLFEG